MPGAKIPVLEVEKLSFAKDGRGIYVSNDGDVLASHAWGSTKTLKPMASGSDGWTVTVLPAASTSAWLKITYISGTSGTAIEGYVPVFNSTVL